jgi:hypothetical protein
VKIPKIILKNPPSSPRKPEKAEKFMRTNATKAKKMSILAPPGVPPPLSKPLKA